MIKISLVHSVSFVWLGKFAAQNDNWRHQSRRLNEYELIFVDSGVLYIACNDTKYAVKAGEYLLMRPCESQYGYKASKCSFHWIHFVYNEEFNLLDGDYILIPETGKYSDYARILGILNQIYFVHEKYADRHYASYLVTTLLLELNAQIKENCEKSGKNAVCNKIEAYIRENCLITTKVNDIAAEIGYSEKYIENLYKKMTGRTIHEFLNFTIMNRAKETILNSALSVSDISASFGFSDPQNFSRTFKRYTGMSPREFKNEFLTVYEK